VSRIHIVIDEKAKARYSRQAKREGKSLGAWLREAADDKLQAALRAERIETIDELRDFFAACDVREKEAEPDWESHRRVLDRSRTGAADVT
jgi:hypothetical protein